MPATGIPWLANILPAKLGKDIKAVPESKVTKHECSLQMFNDFPLIIISENATPK